MYKTDNQIVVLNIFFKKNINLVFFNQNIFSPLQTPKCIDPELVEIDLRKADLNLYLTAFVIY